MKINYYSEKSIVMENHCWDRSWWKLSLRWKFFIELEIHQFSYILFLRWKLFIVMKIIDCDRIIDSDKIPSTLQKFTIVLTTQHCYEISQLWWYFLILMKISNWDELVKKSTTFFTSPSERWNCTLEWKCLSLMKILQKLQMFLWFDRH